MYGRRAPGVFAGYRGFGVCEGFSSHILSHRQVRCNISKTSASVSSGFPNTRKLMKARGRRPSDLIVFECLETPMKHEARAFLVASQSCIINLE